MSKLWDHLKMENLMESAKYNFQMDHNIKGFLSKIKKMIKMQNTNFQKDMHLLNIKEVLLMINLKGLANCGLQMKNVDMKENFHKEISQVKEHWSLKNMNVQDILKMVAILFLNIISKNFPYKYILLIKLIWQFKFKNFIKQDRKMANVKLHLEMEMHLKESLKMI